MGAAAAFSLQASRPALPPSGVGLRNLPLTVGQFRGRELPPDESVFAYLGADEMVDRVYVDDEAEQAVKVSVVFARGWRALHSPRACFKNQGWSVIDDKPIDIPVSGQAQEPIHGSLLIMQKGDSRMATAYTFVAGAATTGSWFLHSLRMAVGRGPSGGALIAAVAGSGGPDQDDDAAEAAASLVAGMQIALMKLLEEEGDIGLGDES
jgi:EpsI family protein